MCSASACKNVLLVADVRGVDPKMVAVIQQDAAEDRHHVHRSLDERCVSDHPDPVEERSDLGERPGWGKDYADALTFFTPLFDGRTIIPQGNINYSLVGITPSQCKTLKITGNCRPRAERQL